MGEVEAEVAGGVAVVQVVVLHGVQGGTAREAVGGKGEEA